MLSNSGAETYSSRHETVYKLFLFSWHCYFLCLQLESKDFSPVKVAVAKFQFLHRSSKFYWSSHWSCCEVFLFSYTLYLHCKSPGNILLLLSSLHLHVQPKLCRHSSHSPFIPRIPPLSPFFPPSLSFGVIFLSLRKENQTFRYILAPLKICFYQLLKYLCWKGELQRMPNSGRRYSVKLSSCEKKKHKTLICQIKIFSIKRKTENSFFYSCRVHWMNWSY